MQKSKRRSKTINEKAISIQAKSSLDKGGRVGHVSKWWGRRYILKAEPTGLAGGIDLGSE